MQVPFATTVLTRAIQGVELVLIMVASIEICHRILIQVHPHLIAIMGLVQAEITVLEVHREAAALQMIAIGVSASPYASNLLDFQLNGFFDLSVTLRKVGTWL